MTQGRHSRYVITLTREDRRHLEALQRQTTLQQGVMRRARVVLLLDKGLTITEVARRVGLDRVHVYKWVKRWLQAGVQGLEEKPGRGHALGNRRARVCQSS